MWDAAVFDEPIQGASVALKVLGNLFQGQNLRVEQSLAESYRNCFS